MFRNPCNLITHHKQETWTCKIAYKMAGIETHGILAKAGRKLFPNRNRNGSVLDLMKKVFKCVITAPFISVEVDFFSFHVLF